MVRWRLLALVLAAVALIEASPNAAASELAPEASRVPILGIGTSAPADALAVRDTHRVC